MTRKLSDRTGCIYGGKSGKINASVLVVVFLVAFDKSVSSVCLLYPFSAWLSLIDCGAWVPPSAQCFGL